MKLLKVNLIIKQKLKIILELKPYSDKEFDALVSSIKDLALTNNR